MEVGFLVVALMAALGGIGARSLARRTLNAGPNLVEDRLARTRGLTFALTVTLVLSAPLVILVLGGLRAMLVEPFFFLSPWTLLAAAAVTPAVLVGYFPIRREIFGDTWSCSGYLGWALRFSVAVGGPWALLFFGPSMTHVAGDGAFITATGLGIGLLLWAVYFDASAAWLLDGREETAPDERRDLDEIAGRAGLSKLRLVGMGPDDADWATVLPLPIARPPSIFVGRTFLDALGRDGRRGLFAREAARIAQVRATSWMGPAIPLLILGASLVEPVLATYDPALAEAYRWTWVAGWILVSVLIGARQAKLELDLDRRAVALLGDDASARTTMEQTLTTTAKVARWPHSAMNGSVPGTLASRLAAITPEEEAEKAKPLAPVVFQSGTDPHTWVAIDDTGVHQLSGVETEGTSATRDLEQLRAHAHQVLRLSFEDLTYLAVAPKRGNMAVLAVSGAGASIHVPIAPGDEARAGEAIAAASPRVRSTLFGPTAAKIGVVILFGALSAFSLSFSGWVSGGSVLLLLLTAVFVLLLWRRTTMSAFGAMALAVGASAAAQVPGHSVAMFDGVCMALLALSGAGTLAIAWRKTDDPDGRFPYGGPWMTGLVLFGASLPTVVGILTSTATGHGALYLAALANGSGGVMLAWVGAGAALLICPGKLRRALAALLLLGGTCLGVAGTDSWVETVAHDPLAAGVPISSARRALPAPAAQFPIDSDSWDLRITSDGKTIVYGSDLEGDEHGHDHAAVHRHRYELRAVDDPERRSHIDGYALALGPGARALLVDDTESEGGAELRLIDLWDASRVHWSLPISAELPGEPYVQIVGDRFVLVAANDESRFVMSGSLRGDPSSVDARTEAAIHGVWPVFNGSGGFLETESSAEKRGTRLTLERILWILRPPVDLRTIVWWADGAERMLATESALSPWCENAVGGSSSILCVAESHDSRWLWALRDDRALAPLGRTTEFGWWRWTGDHVFALGENDLTVIDPSTESEIRYTLRAPTRHEVRFSASGSAVVLGWPEGDGLSIQVYRDLPAGRPTTENL